jgi:DNA-binding response OmpR family regulator
MKILIVDDDKYVADSLKNALKPFFIVEVASSGKESEYLAQSNCFDLIILGNFIPDANAIELSRIVSNEHISAPILMITREAKGGEKLKAFSLGADDCITKPYIFEELLARIRALLRRPKSIVADRLTLGDLTIDIAKKAVSRSDQPIILRRKEYFILEYLMRHQGKVITREALLDHVWDYSDEIATNVVDVHIKYLRDQVDRGHTNKLIKTVYGMGYKISL